MKRLPLFINLCLFAALCAALSFWGLHIFKPKIRPIAAPVMTDAFEPAVGQWGSWFGQAAVAEAAPSNFQLRGVIVAKREKDSAAIIAVDGRPTLIIGVGKELAPGVVLQGVHADHIMVAEAGAPRRIDLPPNVILPGVNPVGSTSPPVNAQ